MLEKLTFKTSAADLREIQAIATQRKSTPSAIVRDAVSFYLGHRSIEGTVRAEMAKVDSSVHAVLKSLLAPDVKRDW